MRHGAHQQVIGEKQETRTEQENITEGTSADGAADRHELRVAEQVQAPERYKTEVKDKGCISRQMHQLRFLIWIVP